MTPSCSKNQIYLRWAFPLLFLLSICGVFAKNPHLSTRISNLSEQLPAEELGLSDYDSQIEVMGDIVHVIWMTDSLDGIDQIFYRRSIDGGETWEPKKLIFRDDAILKSHGYSRRMAVDGDNVYIVFSYYEGSWYGLLGYVRSTDGGASFEAPRVLFTAGGAVHVYDTFVSAANGEVTIGMRNQLNWIVNNTYFIFYSQDYGQTFVQREAYSTTSGSGWSVGDMQRSADRIFLLYTDSYYYYGLQYGRLYLTVTDGEGQNPVTQMISVPSGNGEHKTVPMHDYNYVPKIAFSGDYLYTTWAGLDETDTTRVFFRRSVDGGQTWEAALNLTAGQLPWWKHLQTGQETVVAAENYVYVAFITTDAKVYFMRSDDFGANFYPLQELTKPSHNQYADGGWWPQLCLDPSDATGKTLHVLWTGPTHLYTTDGGATFSNPVISGLISWGRSDRPRIAVGDDGRVHHVAECGAIWLSTGVFSDPDICYRALNPAPEPGTDNAALRLTTHLNPGDGSGDEQFDNMQIAQSPSLQFDRQMTVEMWVNPQHRRGWETYFLTKESYPGLAGVSKALMLGQWREGQPDARIATVDNGYVIVPPDTLPNNQWTHVAITYDADAGSDNFILYINGTEAGKTTATGALKLGYGNFFVGGAEDYRYQHSVTVDEVRFWNVARTQAEIQANMYVDLTGSEAGLMAYYPLNQTTKDKTANHNDGVLMYKEQFVPAQITAISPGESGVITRFELHQNYPNPFNPQTAIRYQLPAAGNVKLIVYNMLGETVRTLVREIQPAGIHTVTWNGRDDLGQPVTSGVYLSRIQIVPLSGQNSQFTQTHKMVLIR